MTEAWIIDAARTPRGIGKVGKGGLAGVHPQHLLSTVLGALAQRNGLDTSKVDDVVAGCGTQAGGALKYPDWLGLSKVVSLSEQYAHLGPMYWATPKMRAMAAQGRRYYAAQS